MTRYRFEVRIAVRGPILSQALGGRVLGIDTAALRGPGGEPALPGNLIRGNLRHAWEAFAKLRADAGKTDDPPWHPDHWLGGPSPAKGNDAPNRALLHFDPLWIPDPAIAQCAKHPKRHRIAIEPKTGAVARGALQVIDSPFDTGANPTFVGGIEADLLDQASADTLAQRIRKGLEYAGALGAMKGAGYGRIDGVDVTALVVPGQAVPAPGPGLSPALKAMLVQTGRLGLVLRLDRPFCIGKPHAGNNRFEAEDYIPGAVIRGAMADRIFTTDREQDCADPSLKPLARHFGKLRISHALAVADPPGPDGLMRPLVPPLTLVEAPAALGSAHQTLYDIARMDQPAGLIHGRAPAFQIDWKSGGAGWACVEKECGGARPEREILVRTAIEKGVAKDSALFAIETLNPSGHLWLAELDITDIPPVDRPAVADAIEVLLREPLRHIGKTKAQAEVTPAEPFQTKAQAGPLLRDGFAILCLQSHARLLPDPYELPGTGGADELQARYAQTWLDLSQGSLRLVRYFARQQLVGGGYLWRRFWSGRRSYNPELLTDAGSVFVLAPTGTGTAVPEVVLQAWLDHGLNQPTKAPDGEDWRANPYVRHNGYGAVAINLDLHWALSPKKEAWHGLD